MAIDDSLREAHSAVAAAKQNYLWDWAGAESEFKCGIELSPGSAHSHRLYAVYLSGLGRHEAAISEMKRALQLDPLSLAINAEMGRKFYYARQADLAIAQELKTLEMEPNSARAYFWLGRSYELKGMFGEAAEQFRRGLTLTNAKVIYNAELGYACARAGKQEEARELLSELDRLALERFVPPFGRAIIYIGLGEREHALQWLEKAYKEGHWAMFTLKQDPRLDPLRSDLRFQDLVRRMNFPE